MEDIQYSIPPTHFKLSSASNSDGALMQVSMIMSDEESSAAQMARGVMDCVKLGVRCERTSLLLVDEVNQKQARREDRGV